VVPITVAPVGLGRRGSRVPPLGLPDARPRHGGHNRPRGAVRPLVMAVVAHVRVTSSSGRLRGKCRRSTHHICG
jgi:hypothetical protein